MSNIWGRPMRPINSSAARGFSGHENDPITNTRLRIEAEIERKAAEADRKAKSEFNNRIVAFTVYQALPDGTLQRVNLENDASLVNLIRTPVAEMLATGVNIPKTVAIEDPASDQRYVLMPVKNKKYPYFKRFSNIWPRDQHQGS